MNKFSVQKALPYLIAIPIFYLVTTLYFQAEMLDGLHLPQGDVVQFEGMKKFSEAYSEKHDGEPPLWNVSMFSGFPEYLISSIEDGPLRYIPSITKGLLSGESTASVFFLCMTMFWLTLLCFGVGPYLAIIGAIAFALNTFFIVSTEAGHMTKMWAIAYASIVLGGMSLVFRRKYFLGFAVFAMALTLQLRANHFQITYYLIFVCLTYVVSELIFAVREGRVSSFVKTGSILLVAALLAGLTQTGRIWMTKEYSKYSTRGARELSTENESVEGKDGLDKEYAFSWSEGKMETLTLMVPYFYGGGSQERPLKDGPFSKVLAKVAGQQQADRLIGDENFRLPMYFGDQPFTAGPVYMGAIICFLFVLGMFVLDNRYRWWMLSATVITMMIAWGKNLEWFNYFLFDYLPGFNKFRTVAMALSLSATVMPIAGFMGLQKVLDNSSDQEITGKLFKALYITGGLGVVLILAAGMMNTGAPNDAALFQRSFGINDPNMIKQFVNALEDERAALIRKDAIRSLVLILLSFGVIWFAIKGKLRHQLAILILGVLIVGDLWLVAKRYLTDDQYVKQDSKAVHQMTDADKAIKQDDSYYRVMNLAGNTFTEARTSYFHHSIGGYFAAKMRRYQDLIDRQLTSDQQRLIQSLRDGQPSFKGLNGINMLNVKYVKIGNKATDVIMNPMAMEHAWFVKEVVPVNSPDEEITLLGQIDLETQAVVDTDKFVISKTDFVPDSTATVKLAHFDNRSVKYESNSKADGLVVFSEIYYPEGWEVKIDGKEVEMVRANYILRALEVPAGKHEITFDFKPESYFVGQKITLVASWIVFLCFVGAIGLAVYQKTKE
ncbi:YfhO family protein [Limibacter armeniacum]|uniref:YfhO family protein n=1 Tax=Limibacter armeniacum TaxID=466084 RepID=UPI002FE5E4D0